MGAPAFFGVLDYNSWIMFDWREFLGRQYFDHYVKGAPAPAWMEKGVPYIERERTELSTMKDRQ